MADYRISHETWEDSRLGDLADLLKTYGIVHWFRLQSFVASSRPDGDLSGMTDRAIERAAEWGKWGKPRLRRALPVTQESENCTSLFVRCLILSGFVRGLSLHRHLVSWQQDQPYAAQAGQRRVNARLAAHIMHHENGRHIAPEPDCPKCRSQIVDAATRMLPACESHAPSSAISMPDACDSHAPFPSSPSLSTPPPPPNTHQPGANSGDGGSDGDGSDDPNSPASPGGAGFAGGGGVSAKPREGNPGAHPQQGLTQFGPVNGTSTGGAVLGSIAELVEAAPRAWRDPSAAHRRALNAMLPILASDWKYCCGRGRTWAYAIKVLESNPAGFSQAQDVPQQQPAPGGRIYIDENGNATERLWGDCYRGRQMGEGCEIQSLADFDALPDDRQRWCYDCLHMREMRGAAREALDPESIARDKVISDALWAAWDKGIIPRPGDGLIQVDADAIADG